MRPASHTLTRSPMLLAASLLLAACAGSNPAQQQAAAARLQQNLRIDVLDSHGKPINGLACRLANEHGYVLAQSGGTVAVKRSARDLEIDCDAPNGLQTKAQLRPRGTGSTPSGQNTAPRSNASVYGNIGLGSFGSHGGIGVNIGFPIGAIGGSPTRPAADDTSNWRYPEWVQLRQGKTLLFDAQGSSSQAPALGYEATRP